MKNKFTGNSIRVPIPNVSIGVLNLNLNSSINKEELNNSFSSIALDSAFQKQIGYVNSSNIVSSDFIGSRLAGTIDGMATMTSGHKNCIIYIWYDNEFGYSCQVIRLLRHMNEKTLPSCPS
jgi:glyceraldehyde 3-phosphate dehydrogenase